MSTEKQQIKDEVERVQAIREHISEGRCLFVDRDGDNIVVSDSKGLRFSIPYKASNVIGQTIIAQGLLIGQNKEMDRVVEDANILRKVGAPESIVGGFVGTPSLERT